MKTNNLLNEMDELLSISEHKAKILGDMIFAAYQSGPGLTQEVYAEAIAMKAEIKNLTRAWLERYNTVYPTNP